MSKKFYKAAVLIIACCVLLSGTVFASEGKYTKDEVVYVSLEHDGSVKSINVVNSFRIDVKGEIVDYGVYEEVINLTDKSQYIIRQGEIIWSPEESIKTFFYQGKVPKKELPWSFEIGYKLDGKRTEAEKLAGADGKLLLSIKAAANSSIESYFRENQMLQISVPFNTKKCRNIKAPGASRMVVGSEETVVFTVMPGESQEIIIEADISDFEYKGISMAITEMKLPNINQINEISDGIGEMQSGIEDMIKGTRSLKSGIKDLAAAAVDISKGMSDLYESRLTLETNMHSIGESLSSLSSSLEQLSDGSGSISEGMNKLEDEAAVLTSSAEGIKDGLKQMLANEQELKALAEAAAQSKDSMTVQLAQALLTQLKGLSAIYTSSERLAVGINDYTEGVSGTASALDQLDDGIKQASEGALKLTMGYGQITPGIKQVYDGIYELNMGLNSLNDGVKRLPDSTDKLIEGQLEMKAGISEASDRMIEEFDSKEEVIPVSFTAPGKNAPNSVQFVIKTPAVEKEYSESAAEEPQKEKLSLWQRFLRLFTGNRR
ncbi:MAG: hypothetical protein ACOZCL_13230 [Bacillota bacterium]